MDPKQTLIDLLEAIACGEANDVRDIADDLACWFARGGAGAGGKKSPVTDAAKRALKAIKAAKS